jgi:hypothetical protein
MSRSPHLRAVADAVIHGVWAAGGFPLEFMIYVRGTYQIQPAMEQTECALKAKSQS